MRSRTFLHFNNAARRIRSARAVDRPAAERSAFRRLATACPLTGFGWAVSVSGILCVMGFVMVRWHELLAAGTVCVVSVLAALPSVAGRLPVSVSVERPVLRSGEDRASDSVSGGTVDASFRVLEREDFVYDLVVRNTSRRTVRNIACIMPCGDPGSRFVLPAIGPDGTKRCRARIERPMRGVIAIGPVPVERSDPFALACRSVTVGSPCTVFVHPRTVPFVSSVFDLLEDAEDGGMGTIADGGDPCDLRAYRDGDSPHRIHWPASLRSPELLVRASRSSLRSGIMLMLSTEAACYADVAEFDTAVRVFASIGVRALSEGVPLSCHAGTWHGTVPDSGEFLDFCSALSLRTVPVEPASVSPESAWKPGVPSSEFDCRTTMRVIVAGPLFDAGTAVEVRGYAGGGEGSGSCLLIMVRPRTPVSLRRVPGMMVGTLTSVDDLPSIMEALS